MNAHYSFAIVGAGPAGATCANALLRGGASSVALIDRARFPRDKTCGDGIGPGVIAILEALELGDILKGHARVGQMAMTSPLGGRMALNTADITRASPLGYVIPRTVFDHALLTAALDRGSTDMTGWSLETARRSGNRWELTLAQTDTGETQTITADVLIGADGATSRVGVCSASASITTSIPRSRCGSWRPQSRRCRHARNSTSSKACPSPAMAGSSARARRP